LNLELKLSNNTESQQNIISLEEIQDSTLGKEGYQLIINNFGVTIRANTAHGAFYGIQTLLQLLVGKTKDGAFTFSPSLPSVEISDQPRFAWRGMHLDVCRHFYDKEFVKKYIDLLAYHKMNTFHWHLTEDQGWRIEIKKYPRLTEIGSYRSETMVEKNWDKMDGIPHQGFYTQEDIREIVQYAADRFITIVPEIEMPGHSLAALAAYPHLGCTGGPYEVAKTWGVFDDVYCAGKDSTLLFLKDVLNEVVALFPGTYIHIGGDECPKKQWEKCPDCQNRIKTEELKNEFELQSWFIREIESYLLGQGKKLIGWDEILEGGLAPEATVMSWRGEKGGIAAAQMGHDVVMSPNDLCYFDHYQGPEESEPLAIGGFTSLKDVYGYQVIPSSLSKQEAKHILGAQANVWTEYITTEEHLEYMILPRMSALAEVLWINTHQRDFETFQTRLSPWLWQMEQMGYNFRPIEK
jgi:hexosaminidase